METMYGSVEAREENMNDNNLELLIHETSNVSERRQQDLSIFRQKFTKDDWDEVGACGLKLL